MADDTVKADFENAVTTAIAEDAGSSISTSDIELALSAGSVYVEATIIVPNSADPSDLQSTLSASVASNSMSAAVVGRVRAVPGIAAVTSGTITASVEAPRLTMSGQTVAPTAAPPALGTTQAVAPQATQTTAAGSVTVIALVSILFVVLVGCALAVVVRCKVCRRPKNPENGVPAGYGPGGPGFVGQPLEENPLAKNMGTDQGQSVLPDPDLEEIVVPEISNISDAPMKQHIALVVFEL